MSLVNLCEGEAGVQSIKSLAASTPGPLAQGFISNKSPPAQMGNSYLSRVLLTSKRVISTSAFPRRVCLVIVHLP